MVVTGFLLGFSLVPFFFVIEIFRNRRSDDWIRWNDFHFEKRIPNNDWDYLATFWDWKMKETAKKDFFFGDFSTTSKILLEFDGTTRLGVRNGCDDFIGFDYWFDFFLLDARQRAHFPLNRPHSATFFFLKKKSKESARDIEWKKQSTKKKKKWGKKKKKRLNKKKREETGGWQMVFFFVSLFGSSFVEYFSCDYSTAVDSKTR